jgi:meckelin
MQFFVLALRLSFGSSPVDTQCIVYHSTGCLLCSGIIQYLVYILFTQGFVEDKLMNFIDLCSVSNISLFVLIEDHYGYYIHGRSPHGTADVPMSDMLTNLERESKRMSSTRGLQAKSNEQTFIVKLDRSCREQYSRLRQSYQVERTYQA